MKQYDDYKDSGLPWLGKVPAHWEVRKITRAFSNLGSGTTPEAGLEKYYENGTISWVNTGDLNDDILETCNKAVTELALRDYSALKVYPAGTILVAMYGATIGKTSLLNFEACTNQACCALTVGPMLNEKYAFFYFLANKPHIISLGYGGGQPNISQYTIKQLRIPVPPLPEQHAIAAYLDLKTGQLGQLLKQKEALRLKLQQQRQALINEAVTRGLNPDAPRRESGVTWLGEVPAHWEVKKLKYTATLKSGDTITAETIEPTGAYPVYGGNGLRGYTDTFTHEGDFALIGRQGALCGNINYASGKFFASEHALVAAPIVELETVWLGELLCTMNLGQYSQASAQPGISADRILNLLIPVPPLSEQRDIVGFIEAKTGKIATVLKTLNKQLKALAAYRQAVIAEAVTGKVDVRGETLLPGPASAPGSGRNPAGAAQPAAAGQLGLF